MPEVVNVCFHGIGTPQVGADPEAEAYFVESDVFYSVLDELAGRADIAISFDDGYASDVEIALPALRERGLTASFFPLAGSLGHPGHVDPAGIRKLVAEGMTVGSHGMRHRSWRGLDKESAEEEFIAARSLISEAAGTEVWEVACPFGAYDRQALSRLRRLGYTRVLTSDRRRAQPHHWLQPRYSVLRRDTVESVKRTILLPPSFPARVRQAAAAKVKAWR